MSSATERAAQRLNAFAAQHGDAVRLARLASLAVRIDAPLLRALRTRFLRGSDPGIEADLWFSPLAESMSSQGLVLSPQVAEILRNDLAAETVDGRPVLLEAAARLIDEAHRDWPASLRMEERVTCLALRGDAGALGEIDALLRRAAKAMVEDAERGMEIARWALRALPRLPPAARASEAALLLALGASERLGGRAVLSGDEQRSAALPDAGWILPPDALARRTRIGVQRLLDGLAFIDAEGAGLAFELPATTPLVVELRWTDAGRERATTLAIHAGQQVAIPAAATGIRIRTLSGDEYVLESGEAETDATASQPEPEPQADDVSLALAAAVRVRFVGPALPPADEVGLDLAGFFVAPDLVLALAGGVTPRTSDTLWAGSWIVTQGSAGASAEVVAVDGALVLLRLPGPVTGALVLERTALPAAIEPGARWASVHFAGTATPLPVQGHVAAIVQQGQAERPFGRPVAMLEIEPDAADEPSTPWPAPPPQLQRPPISGSAAAAGRRPMPAAGAPVIIGGRVVGQVAAPSRSPATAKVLFATAQPQRLLAVPADRLNDFIYRSLRPAEHEPTVVVVCASEPPPEPAALERLKAALRSARVRPVIDSELFRPGASFEESTINDLNDSEGAAIVTASEIPRGGLRQQHQLRMIAYRRWAKPDYPVAIFGDSRRPDVRQPRIGRVWDLLRPLQPGPATTLDAASDADLEAHAVRTFDRLSQLRDAASGEAAVKHRLSSLITQGGPAGGTRQRAAMKGAGSPVDEAVAAIGRAGLHAEIDWRLWLQDRLAGKPDVEGREFIDLAAMFTLPADTAQRVRAAATAPQGQRALCLNTMPAQIARTLIRRAWIGEAPPVSLVFREQQWPQPGSGEDAPHVVAGTLGRLLDCDQETAMRLLLQMAAPLFLIFATRPLPPRPYLDSLQQQLPHAIPFFLCGDDMPDPSLLEGGALTPLPPLRPDTDGPFIRRYKALMELVAPRSPAAGASAGSSRGALRKITRGGQGLPKRTMTKLK